MRIGYCSPFNPMKSGISDFSEELIIALKNYVELVIFTPVELEKKNIEREFEVHKLSELDHAALRESLDLIVYQVGNNIKYHGEIVDMLLKYPGILELHDFGLHHLAAEKYFLGQGPVAYYKEVCYCHGEYGGEIAQRFLEGKERAPWETHTLDLCMNKRYIDNAIAVILHSEAAKQMTLGFRSDVPVINIMLHAEIEPDVDTWKQECRKELNLDKNLPIFGSFGFATRAKRIIPILNALKKYKDDEQKDFLYVIVGEAHEELNLKETITQLGLEHHVITTGFTSLDEFKRYMGACDFCFNLRYPTQGESSASLHRMLGMGKPAIVTDIGTFADYPDDIVLKVRYGEDEIADIYSVLLTLLKNPADLKERGKKALKFAQEHCDLDKNCQMYAEFFRQVKEGTWQPDYEDTVITRLCELGLTDRDYLEHVYALICDV